MRGLSGWMTVLAAMLLLAPDAAAQPARRDAGVFRTAAPPPSVAFALELRDHLVRAGVRRPSGRVAVWIGAGNRNPRLSLAETRVPQALWAGVAPLVDAYVARRDETTALELSFYLERLPGSEGEVGRWAQVPALRDMGRLTEGMRSIAYHSNAYADSGRLEVETRAGLLVDARGRPALVENRLHGDPQFNRYLTALMYEMRFVPARQDGEPVAVWLEGPFGFAYTEER
jgi:hypothetical protein